MGFGNEVKKLRNREVKLVRVQGVKLKKMRLRKLKTRHVHHTLFEGISLIPFFSVKFICMLVFIL